MYDNIRIVMVNTSHPGNIGSAARAMKTMGLSRLYLVDPQEYPSERAVWLASGAADVLENAVVVDTVEEAVSDCSLIIGTSARIRRIPWPLFEPQKCGLVVAKESEKSQVALIFGREAMGLSNEELQLCHYHVNIPGNPDYDVLNVAAAIQVICYEIRRAHLEIEAAEEEEEFKMPVDWVRWDEDLATHEALEKFHQHFQETLLDLDFFDPENPRQLLTRLRRLYQRSRMDKMELNMMRGILTRIQLMVKGEHPGGGKS